MEWTDPAPIFVAFTLLLMFIIKTGSFWNKDTGQNFPPGPRPLPIIGNLHIMDIKRPYCTLLKLSETYGPVFSIQMGSRKTVVLSGYEAVKEALVNQAEAFAERPKIPIFEALTEGYGVTFSHGENWKVMRRFTISTLRDFGMGKRAIEDPIVEECRYLIENLESRKGKPFETTTIINGAVGNIIVAVLLGKRFDYEDPQFIRLQNLIGENFRLLGSPSIAIYNLFPALGFLFKDYKKVLQNRDDFHAFTQVIFKEHLKKLDKNDQRSFIDVFFIRQKEEKSGTNRYFHNENLKTLVLNMFAAGTESTSTSLRWGLLLMMKYPEIQQKVQNEIATVLGSNLPCGEHRSKMPYTNAVVHEIQRFANMVSMNGPHSTTMDVTLKGYFIPKGTYIIPFLGSVLQDKSQWERPGDFYPEHFLDPEGRFVKKEAFMPFSAGRRMCAGENLAKMEIFLFFTSLLQRFTFQPAPGVSRSDLDLTPAIGLAAPPMPHQICAVPRV